MTTLAEILTQLESDVSVRSHFGNLDAQRVQALIRVIRVLERQRDGYRSTTWAWEEEHVQDTKKFDDDIECDDKEVLNAYKGENGGGL